MECVFFLVLIVVVAAVVHYGATQAKNTNDAWSTAARKLGLSFDPPGLMQRRSMRGTYQGFRVAVETVSRGSGNNRRTYTRFTVGYPLPLGLGLQLSREGFFTGVTKLFGAQDIQIGGAAFDQDILVKGDNASAVRDFLTSARRMRIHRFLVNFDGSTITDSGIEWETRGTMRDAGLLVSTVKSMIRMAWYLTGDRDEDRQIERAMEAQDQGRPEEALRILQQQRSQWKPAARDGGIPVAPLPAVSPEGEAPRTSEPAEPATDPPSPAEEFHPEPVEEQLLEGELLYLAGRRDEAKAVLQQAQAESPADQELRDWTEHVQREGPATTAPATPVGESSLDVKTVCETLFDPSKPSFSVNETFEEQYAGQTVRWSGVLKSVDSLNYDLVFTDRSGCKAVLEVYELESVYGSRVIRAIAQFPEAELDALKGCIGSEVSFQGELFKADGFMRNLYVADAQRS